MTIQECYALIGADYESLLRRLEKEERILRFLSRFLEEGSFTALRTALAAQNAEEAFRAAHSLKGVCMNLELTALYNASSALAEALRGGVITPAAGPLFEQVSQDYQTAVKYIGQLLQP